MKRIYCLFLLVCTMLSVPAFAQPAQISLAALDAPYTQGFNSLGTAALNDVSTLPLGWTFLETGSNANTTYTGGNGSLATGNTYSFGMDAERSLGGLQSGSLVPTLGGTFTNNTGAIISSLEITYWGEQWRIGALGRLDRIDFQYSTDATSLSNGTWIDVNQLDFIGPNLGGPIGALIGNNSPNHTLLVFTIDGLSIPNGATFRIRWSSFDASGADDGLGIDDFTIIPHGTPPEQPAITLSPLTLDFDDVNINTTETLFYEVTGSNLTEPILAESLDPLFTLSLDGTVFTSSVTLPPGESEVLVRFAPLVNGPVSSSISHTSSGVTSSLTVVGNGFDQVANIIPISQARLQPVGTTVTVGGRVTVGLELGNPAYIQDPTGGIPVFDFTLSHSVEIGDSVIVTGPIGLFSNQKQISGSGIFFTLPDVGKRFIVPKPIAIGELAANEGLLVTVQNVEVVNKSFVFYPQSTEKMKTGGVEADLRIDGDTDIPGLTKPQGTVNITGVVGRFNTFAQLLPRFREDVPGVDEPSTPADEIPKTLTLDIANWNLEFFGAARPPFPQEYGPENENLQRQNVRTVIEHLNPDIIAVNEVSSDSLFEVLVSELPRYKGICSPRYSHDFDDDGTFPYQKVCYIYDSTTVEVLSKRVLFQQLYDSARTSTPSLLPGCPGGAESFYSSGRLPFLLTANVTIEGVTQTINLINIHAKSGAAAADRLRRLYDLAVLKDSLDAYFQDEKFIILGDLNDDLDQSITSGEDSPYEDYVNDPAHYAPITKTLSDAGARSTVGFQDVIDHQILSDELELLYIDGSVQIVTPFAIIPNYGTTTTDHLPVISRYVLGAPAISFVRSTHSITEDSTAVYTAQLTLSTPLTGPKQVSISIGGSAAIGNDYQTVPAATEGVITLHLPAGATSTTFTYQIIDDAIDEVEEAAVFAVLPGLGINVGSQDTLTVSIGDNDVSPVYVTAPANEAVNVPTNPNVTSIVLPGSSSYTIELSETSNFAIVAFTRTGASNTQAFSGLKYNTRYYNRVKTNTTIGYGAVRSFTTLPASSLAFVSSPANGAVNVQTVVNIVSNVVPGATSYTIELSETNDFAVVAFTSTGATPVRPFAGLRYNQQYFNRVTTDVSGGAFGQVRSFTTQPATNLAFVSSPANGAVNVPTVVSIVSNVVPGATSYTIELSETNDFAVVAFSSTGATPVRPFFGLKYSQQYFNRVTTDLSGGAFGQVRSFTTQPATNLAFVSSPANGSVNVPTVVSIVSNVVPGAASYTIELSETNDFAVVAFSSTGATPVRPFFGLRYNQQYFNRVTTDVSGGAFGQVRSFTTQPATNLAFVSNPANGAVNVPTVTSIVSNFVPGATSYTIELSETNDFAVVAFTSTGATPVRPFYGLKYSQQYFNRVTTDVSGGAFGPVRSFTTQPASNVAFVNSPANNAVNVGTNVLIVSNFVAGATSYTIELSLTSNFAAVAFTQTGGSPVLPFTGLSVSTTYFNRVLTDVSGGVYGVVKSFTTRSTPGGRFASPDEVTAVEDERADFELRLHGNPFRERLVVVVESKLEDQAELNLMDMNGRTVHASLAKTNTEIEIGHSLASGIYLLRANSGKRVKTIRVVKIE